MSDERPTNGPQGVAGGGMLSAAEVEYERWQADVTAKLTELRAGQLAIMRMLERIMPGREA